MTSITAVELSLILSVLIVNRRCLVKDNLTRYSVRAAYVLSTQCSAIAESFGGHCNRGLECSMIFLTNFIDICQSSGVTAYAVDSWIGKVDVQVLEYLLTQPPEAC